jgi:gas vesicle protein
MDDIRHSHYLNKKRRQGMETKDCIKGFVVGSLVGAALGVLFAPKSGKALRKDICRGTSDLYEKMKDISEEGIEKMEKLMDQAKDSLLDKKERLEKGLEAGVNALKK